MARKTSRKQNGTTENTTEQTAPVANTAPESTTEERATQTAQESNDMTETQNQTETAPAQAGVPQFLRMRVAPKSGKVLGAIYQIPGVPGTIRVARGVFDGDPTPSLTDLRFKAPNADRAAKLAAKQERKAKAAESAQEKAARLEAKIAKAQANAQKNAERLAKLRAKITPTAQEQTEQAHDGGVSSVPAEEMAGTAAE